MPRHTSLLDSTLRRNAFPLSFSVSSVQGCADTLHKVRQMHGFPSAMLSKSPRQRVPWRGTPQPGPTRLTRIGIVALLFIALWLLLQGLSCCRLDFGYVDSLDESASTSFQPPPYAYVTLLASNPVHDNSTVADDEDEYFVATRVMAYQLLHAPQSATKSAIPFVVLCTPDIPVSQLTRLEKDGAIVVVVEKIAEGWTKPGHKRWRDMFAKLHVLQMIEFEKVLFLDSDVFVARCLDGIFTDETTSPQLVDQNSAMEDEGPLPDSYLFSAQKYFEGYQHDYPYPPGNTFSGGFFVVQPSLLMYNHYLTISKIEGRFDSNSMEQSLLNYAHRKDGPMPWNEILYLWTTTWPSRKELQAGAATLHEKWWDQSLRLDPAMRQLWLNAKADMYLYYNTSDVDVQKDKL